MSRVRVWTTSSGEKIPFNKLSDRHLANIIRVIEKLVESYPSEQVYMGNSDIADDWVESENRINGELYDERCAMLIALLREQKRRSKP